MKDCLDDGGSYKDNMTSTYTLDYTLHQNGSGIDRMRSYGNLSPSGLRSWQSCMASAPDIRCCYELMRDERQRCNKPSAALCAQSFDQKGAAQFGGDRQNCVKTM